MKKFSGKVFAGVFAAAVMASAAFASVSAADYVQNPDWDEPETTEVGESDVKNVGKGETAYVGNSSVSGVELTDKALEILKKQEAGLNITVKGATVSISAVQLSKLDKVSFALGVSNTTGKVTTDDKVDVPANSVLIQPDFGGAEFEVTVYVTLPKGVDAKKAKLYHCDGKGKVEEVKDGLKVDAWGEPYITISHASYYIISEGEIKSAEGASTGDGKGDGDKENVNTGVTLPIALVALAGGSVAVSAIAAKKRK